MKINKLKINRFGKLANKEINLTKGINIIYGENESGKSTTLKFIVNSFYGTSKNKKGKDLSDYEKFKPWNQEEFSGKLEYELDNNEKYEIFREFGKKNPKIFNKNGEDISKKYNIDKNKGNEFFYEQTHINEELFLSTLAIMQQEVKIDKNMQNQLIQKISNIVRTGEDNVSYKKALEKLNKKQLEEIGTERTREKPINIILQKIKEIEHKKNQINYNEENIKNIDEEENNLIKEINKNAEKINLIKEINIKNNNIKIEEEKIKINKNINLKNTEEMQKLKNDLNILENELENIKAKNKKEENKIKENKNKTNKKLIIFFIILILLNILYYNFISKITENKIIKNIFFLTVPMFLIFTYFLKNKQKINIYENKNNQEEEIFIKINKMKNEIEILEKNKKEIENQINKIDEENKIKNNLENEKIKNNYLNKIEINEINKIINLDNLEKYKNEIENKINYLKLELHKKEIQKNTVIEEKENLSLLEEELSTINEKYVELIKLNKSIEITKNILEKCYEKMKENISPKFTQNLSTNINKITGGKYKEIKYTDEEGLIVEIENGNYISADLLSIGTIEQLYFSLRLAILNEISEEKMPIILDELFAYYDEERLKNVLEYINNEFSNHQIIIFTCTSREKNVLDKLNIKYNLVNM